MASDHTTAASGAASQPEALRLAHELESRAALAVKPSVDTLSLNAAAELRRLHSLTTAARAAQEAEPAPIDMVLHCPACGLQHIDAPEPDLGPSVDGSGDMPLWSNPSHRSHLCHGCGHVWRPADVPTNGVAAVKTKGKADSPIAALAPRPQADAGAAPRITDPAIAEWVERHDLDRVLRGSHARAAVEDAQTLHLVPGAVAPAAESAPSVPEGWRLVPEEKLRHAHRQASLAVNQIVEFAKAKPGGICGWIDDACTAAEIAEKDFQQMLSAAAPQAPAAPTAAAAPGAGELIARSWMVRLGGDGSVPAPATAPAPAAGAAPSDCPYPESPSPAGWITNNTDWQRGSATIYAQCWRPGGIPHPLDIPMFTLDQMNAQVDADRANRRAPTAAPAAGAGAAPTDAEIDAVWKEGALRKDAEPSIRGQFRWAARAVLARWGAAAPAPESPARTMHITELHGTYGWDGKVRGAWSRSYDAPMPAPDAPETPRLIGVDVAAGPDTTAYWTEEPAPFQQRVQPWLMACFGPMIAGDREERNHRLLEESLELVQACGCSASEAHQLVDYVYGRPVGEPMQEVGGVMVTLAALCLANGLDMHAAGETELARIWTKVEAIRAKQAAKPKHSPLPEHAPTRAADYPQGAPIVWPKARDVGRIGDMSPSANLRVGLDSDNDVFVSVWDEDGGGSVEFCNGGGGGGRSIRTRLALIALMVAMEQDNAERPALDWWAQRMGGAKQEGGAA